MNPAPAVLPPSEPSEKPAFGSNVLPSEATIRPHVCLTKPRAIPDAVPFANAAFNVPCA
jgi:hypothetical protein